MLRLLVLYTHLVATCVAIGLLILTDLKILACAAGRYVVIPAPSRLEKEFISIALGVLYATGGALILFGLQERADYLANQKLLAKLVLVGLLTVNAMVLHYRVFPHLQRSQPVAHWTADKLRLVSLSVGLSTTLWLYSAFLGVARPWSFQKPMVEVLAVALAAWLLVSLGVRMVLAVASRGTPDGRHDWLDRIKRLLGHIGPVFGEDAVDKPRIVLATEYARSTPRRTVRDLAPTPHAHGAVQFSTPTRSTSLGAASPRLSLVGWVAVIGIVGVATVGWQSEWSATKLLAFDPGSLLRQVARESASGSVSESTEAQAVALDAERDAPPPGGVGTGSDGAIPGADTSGAEKEVVLAAPASGAIVELPIAQTAALNAGQDAASPGGAGTPSNATVHDVEMPDAGKDVVLEFTGPCWVDIRDSSKQFRLRGELHEGIQRKLEGVPPYTVLLGNKSNVRMTIDGEPIAIPKRRFTVDPQKLSDGEQALKQGPSRQSSPDKSRLG